ncbi:tryptophan halogenase [Parvularcula dongshanensis]|uniref:Tryptophan halogenase n=2 Tax=Parvularcula dongshanensis TaxID=1173995 RepID=A0A840I6S9_9PROT|nr:tryptophan halogenase [Parvularcula dongshanensis]
MAAAALAQRLGRSTTRVFLVESDEIGTVGVGEATLPHIRSFNEGLGIDEAAFMRATEATFKLGIEFRDWGKLGDRYTHPFGDYGRMEDGLSFHHLWLRLRSHGSPCRLDDYSYAVRMAEENRFTRPQTDPGTLQSSFGYAYQFDSTLYGRFLRDRAVSAGIERVEGRIVDWTLDGGTGHVTSIQLADGRSVAADLYVDCSGFRGLLIEGALETGYENWQDWLPCDRALAVPSEVRRPLPPYTQATARSAGWQWRIPLQHRTGNGYVYCSEFVDEESAREELLSNLDSPALADPRQLRFTTGRRRKFWNKNVVALGLAGGFLEPLESTSIHLVQEGIAELIELFPDRDFHPGDESEYNRRMALNFERVRDFLLLHYVATERSDTEMWRYFRAMRLPDSLEEKIEAWRHRGHVVAYEFGVFLPPSWIAVFMGQNVLPRSYDCRAERLPIDALRYRMKSVREDVSKAVGATPAHESFISACGAASESSAAHVRTNPYDL